MATNNNFNSFGLDDLRDDDLNNENVTLSSDAYNIPEEKEDINEEDEPDDDNDLDDEDDVDADEEDISGSTTGTYPGEKQEDQPDEIPEKHESENEPSEYPHETEYNQPARSSDASYSEQKDVTPPNPHEFPSVGNAETDFVSRPYSRKTGRMVGHEPGTEGI